MSTSVMQDIIERIKDPDYAKRYGAEMAKVDFAITFFKARKETNLTQKEMAEKLGVSQPYIAKIEGGEANPTLSTIGKLLAILGLKLVTSTAPLAPVDAAADNEATISNTGGPTSARLEKEPVVAEPVKPFNKR